MKVYKLFLFFTFLFLVNFNLVSASETTVKIYPVDDAFAYLYDQDAITDWETARNYQSTIVNDPLSYAGTNNDIIVVRSDKQARGFYRIYRISLVFDTSVIPDNAILSAVSFFGMKGPSNNTSGTQMVISSHQRVNETLMQKQDWFIDTYGTWAFSEQELLDNTPTEFHFDDVGIDYINLQGNTVLGIRTNNDFYNVDSGSIASAASIHTIEASDQNLWPYLEITYEIPDPEVSLEQKIASLIESIENSDLSKAQKQSYLANLKKLFKFVENEQYQPAINQVEVFVTKVLQDLSKESIGEELASELIDAANDIINDIVTLKDEVVSTTPLMTQIASPFPPESAEWEDDLLGNGAPDWCGNTIGECGCAITALAMLAQSQGITTGLDGKSVNPANFNDWLHANGGYTINNEVIWEFALQYFSPEASTSHFSLDHFNTANSSLINQYLNRGIPVVGFKRSQGHYLLLTDILSGGEYAVRDPLWYLTQTTNDTKDIVNHVQDYDGGVDQAKLFGFHPQPKKLPAWIEIHLESPAELVLTDSQGRRAGFDPVSGEFYTEIPGSSYAQAEGVVSQDDFGEEVHLPKILMVQNPQGDEFELVVIGTDTGEYDLTIATNGGGDSYNVGYESENTTQGQIDTYQISLTGDANAGHGNDIAGCDPDNPGKKRVCEVG